MSSINCPFGGEVKLNVKTLLDEVTVSGSDYEATARELGFNLNTGAYAFRYMQAFKPSESGVEGPIPDKKLFKYNPETGIVTMPSLSDIKRYAAVMGIDADNTAEFTVTLYFKTANANLSGELAAYTVEITTAASDAEIPDDGLH